jgi:hypothetical protein
VEQGGGRVVVQDPVEASYDSMPRCALAVTEHAEIQPTGRLAAAVARLVGEQAETPPAEPSAELEAEVRRLLASDPLPRAMARDYGGFSCLGGAVYPGAPGRRGVRVRQCPPPFQPAPPLARSGGVREVEDSGDRFFTHAQPVRAFEDVMFEPVDLEPDGLQQDQAGADV